MTQLVTSADPNLLALAIAKVEIYVTEISQARPGDARLGRHVPEEIEAAVDEAWEKIKKIVTETARRGWDSAVNMVNELIASVEATAVQLAKKAEQFRAELVARLHDLMRETFDMLLRSLRAKVHIGDSDYVLSSVQLETKFVFSSSLEASLTTLCKFVGSGDFVVKGTYSPSPS